MKKIKKAQVGDSIRFTKPDVYYAQQMRQQAVTPRDTIWKKGTDYVIRNPDQSTSVGRVTKKGNLTKKQENVVRGGNRYTDDEIRASMNKRKKNGGKITPKKK